MSDTSHVLIYNNVVNSILYLFLIHKQVNEYIAFKNLPRAI